jgi:hypothetical protein
MGLGGSTGADSRELVLDSHALGLVRELARHEAGARAIDLLPEVLQDFVGLTYLGRDEQVDNDTACAQPLDLNVLDVNFGGSGDIRDNALLEVLVVAYRGEIDVERQCERHPTLPGWRCGFCLRGCLRSRLRGFLRSVSQAPNCSLISFHLRLLQCPGRLLSRFLICLPLAPLRALTL